jgi:hypothetical protein
LLSGPHHNVDVGAAKSAAFAWVATTPEASSANAPQFVSFVIPSACGRVIYSDLHDGADDYCFGGYCVGPTFVPGSCASGDLSPQEKVMEYLLFSLGSPSCEPTMAGSPLRDAAR